MDSLDVYFFFHSGRQQTLPEPGNFRFRDITQAGVNGGIGIKTERLHGRPQQRRAAGYLRKASRATKTPHAHQDTLHEQRQWNDRRAAEYGLNESSFTMQSYFFRLRQRRR